MQKDASRRRFPLADRVIEVVDDTLTGEVLLDEALKMMKQSEKMSVASWIDLMSGMQPKKCHQHTYTHAYTCIHTYTHVYTHTHTYIHIYTHIYTYIHTYKYTPNTILQQHQPHAQYITEPHTLTTPSALYHMTSG